MRKLSILTTISALTAALWLAACSSTVPSEAPALEPVDPQPAMPLTFVHPSYHKVTPDKALAMMQEGVVVLDVRSPEEWAAGHIEGSVNVPCDTLVPGQVLEAVPDLNEPVLVHCRSGVRAEQASRILVETGYTNVNNMYGTLQWPYGLITADGKEAPPAK